MAPPRLIRIHSSDNVAVALSDLSASESIDVGDEKLTLRDSIPAGHKVAVTDLSAGDDVRRYGWSIGRVSQDVQRGCHIHVQNLRSALDGEFVSGNGIGVGNRGAEAKRPAEEETPSGFPATFEGYLRPDGRVGTRNEIWVISAVGCVNRAADRIALFASDAATRAGIDGIVPITHPYGCSQLGDDLQHTRQILAGLARNPNAGGVVVIGLGCENNRIAPLVEAAAGLEAERVRFYNAQEVDDEVEVGVRAVGELLEQVARDKRTTRPVSDLTIGVKCGGSDGFSGISANPVVGSVVDTLCDLGARVLITEVPEMFGAEDLLLQRAVSESVASRAAELFRSFRDYYTRHGLPVFENPSPGNKDGGITTLEEKSLGAVQKGGRAPVVDVLEYGRPIEGQSRPAGLAIVESPGNDGVSCTALTAAGASLILFTTGRGTPLGAPVPTIKISSNGALAERKSSWIDFNCGPLLEGSSTRGALAEALYRRTLDFASGENTRNELSGNREIAIWKAGVTL